MIKKIFSALCVVLFATSMMAQTGLTCNDPIPVDKSYTAHVNADDELSELYVCIFFFLYRNRTFEYYCTIFLSVILKNSYLNRIIGVLIFTYF